jgi:hypothetical protein
MRHAFEDALDQAGQATAAEPVAPPQVRFTPELSEPPQGHHLLWEAAAAWTPEADPPPPASPAPVAPRPSDAPGDVARELRLRWLNTAADVARARRRFMWENHPDRRADLDRDLANRRVALANMLLDDVQARLARRGR